MAFVHEETVTIKFSQLAKSKEQISSIVQDELLVALEQVCQELVGSSIVAEVVNNQSKESDDHR